MPWWFYLITGFSACMVYDYSKKALAKNISNYYLLRVIAIILSILTGVLLDFVMTAIFPGLRS